MPSITNPGQKSYLGYGYSIYRSGAGYAIYAWPASIGSQPHTRARREELATAHYFERSTDAARWLQAALRRLGKEKSDEGKPPLAGPREDT